MIKTLIVDDHAIVRKGLRQLLAETPDMVVTGEAGNGHEVFSRALKSEYDVVLLDISMPGRNGVDVLKELKTQRPRLPVLVLTMHPEEQYAVRALRAGASGYLTKESAPEELIAAIRRIASGGTYVSTSLAEKLAIQVKGDPERPPHELLSDREYQVVCMMASGKTVKTIAAELSLSVKTISTYRTRILKKLNLKSTAEVTRYAIKSELVC